MNENKHLLSYVRVFEGECKIALEEGVCCVGHVNEVVELIRHVRTHIRNPLKKAVLVGIKEPVLDNCDTALIMVIGKVRAIRSRAASLPAEWLVTGKAVFTMFNNLGDMESVEIEINRQRAEMLIDPAVASKEVTEHWEMDNPGTIN